MTVQPTRDQLRALAADHRAMDHDVTADAIDGLLDQLDRAEHRIARLEAQTGIRGRAVAIYQARAREAEAERDQARRARDVLIGAQQVPIRRAEEAEARIKAVEDVLDTYEEENANTPHRYPTPHGDGLGPVLVDADDIRRALEG